MEWTVKEHSFTSTAILTAPSLTLVTPTARPFRRLPDEQEHVTAAQGYLALGMTLDANAELEKVDPYVRHLPEVLAVRVEIYRTLEKWELMATVGKKLSEYEPSIAKWALMFAHALRRSGALERGWEVLLDACTWFPMSAGIRYDLACCECQLGNIQAAKQIH